MEPQNQYRSAIPSYLDNPILKPRNFYETGFEESLEKIVLNDEPQTEGGLVERVFTDRSRTLKSMIKALFNEVLTREHLNSALLKDIDSALCKTGSYLEQIREMTRRQYTPDLEIALSRRRTQLESRLMDLDKEKRQEYFRQRYLILRHDTLLRVALYQKTHPEVHEKALARRRALCYNAPGSFTPGKRRTA